MADVPGKVYLVGAGPGDPGLITVRGRECLEKADVVVYDRLVNDQLLALAPAAEHIYAGKEAGGHRMIQEDINALLIDRAQAGLDVVRLKGGDPFVFGRGGEEAIALIEESIPFEIVPGITAGVAAPAFAGIPVTYRGVTTSVSIIGAHTDRFNSEGIVDLSRIALEGTLVFYMGVRNLPRIANQLVELGRSEDTPAAVIEWATWPRQRTITGTLATLHELAVAAGIQPPAIVVVGEVVELRDTLNWFENRPLMRKRIAVPRTRSQPSELAAQLNFLGAEVFEFALVATEFVRDDTLVQQLGEADWVIFTSVNAVESVCWNLERHHQDARAFGGMRVCAVGAATAESLKRRFIHPDAAPDQYEESLLLLALRNVDDEFDGKLFLLPHGDAPSDWLAEALERRGAKPRHIQTYATTPISNTEERVDNFVQFRAEIVAFPSSSTVRHFCRALGQARLDELKGQVQFAAIGPRTAATAREHGLEVAIEPAQHDIPAFAQAILKSME